MEGNSIVGVEKHETDELDEKYTQSDLKVLNMLGLNEKDIKSKK